MEVQRKRSYADVAGRSRYQDELNIGRAPGSTREQDGRCRSVNLEDISSTWS